MLLNILYVAGGIYNECSYGTSEDNNTLVGTDAVQLGIKIMNKMEERDIICKDHGNIFFQEELDYYIKMQLAIPQ